MGAWGLMTMVQSSMAWLSASKPGRGVFRAAVECLVKSWGPSAYLHPWKESLDVATCLKPCLPTLISSPSTNFESVRLSRHLQQKWQSNIMMKEYSRLSFQYTVLPAGPRPMFRTAMPAIVSCFSRSIPVPSIDSRQASLLAFPYLA